MCWPSEVSHEMSVENLIIGLCYVSATAVPYDIYDIEPFHSGTW